MNAFSTAMADELAQVRTQLVVAGECQDEAAVVDALERLRDLTEISERAREGLLLPSR
ncbi:MAG: hypothetical protein ABJA33_11325 [Pedococcus sp.]